jgi:lambda family phage portal protein
MTVPALKIVDQYGRNIPRAAMLGEYEGATTGRRMGMWGTSSVGPNTSLYSSLNTLRGRTRELRRNNPLAESGAESYVANIIGSGINPRWQIKDNPDLKQQIQELWNDWTDESDFYDLLDFYGQQSLGVSGLIDAGEFLCRFVDVGPGEYDTVPLKLQLLEADHLDETFNSAATNGNEIRMSIEIDKLGRRQAYWIWNEHPGEMLSFKTITTERIRIPKADMLHVYKPLRIGQMRGRPWLASIIVKLRELDQYEDAELVRKKTAAMFGGFITETMNAEGAAAGTLFGRQLSSPDVNANDIIALEPGTFPVLPVGKAVEFSKPADVGITYDVWIKQQLREVAAGMGITYEQLTGDLSGVNYSSIRAGLLEFRRRVNQLQHQIIIYQFCRPIARRWMDTAVLCGALRIPDYFQKRRQYLRILWRPDGWAWVDPVKDQLAEQMAIRNGFKSRARVVAEKGDDVENVDIEIAEDNARADKAGLVLDSDPRKTASSGAMQKAVDETITESAPVNPAKGV